ncbi:serine/threonine-protein kinase [Nonomuraea sp. NPDC003804]|uniref:serine/threonine protein kinase n=1 Tax=Nonomuraea sp. NPDC003804 TaxID=3154547 RepID=UPI0033A65D02
MRSYDPRRSGDPISLGGYTIAGRLGEGGQGVVYLATDRAGARVAIKWLRFGDAVAAERFLREVQVAQQVAPFCTAQVLATGAEHDRPYIVSEYVEGPTLQHVVRDQGPRAGPALYRLAIGTATALAAIHQAGIVHRDFKPANVIIAPDGPRVIDFGIARALDTTATISSTPVGTPSFMAPEQFLGHPVGAAADLFAWASTIAYAASGRAPFGSDTMPAVINRILHGRPDVSNLDEPLSGVVHACLSKDPTLRPTAEQVIMRLLQHPVAPGGMLREAAAASMVGSTRLSPGHGAPRHWSGGAGGPVTRGPTAPPPGHAEGGAPPAQPRAPARSGKPGRRLAAGLAAGITALLLVVVAVAVPWGRFLGRETPSASPAVPTNATAPPSRPAATPRGQVARPLPGTQAAIYERPGDPITLTAYSAYDKPTKDWTNYARDALTGPFRRYGGYWETALSPDGRYIAGRGKNYTSDDYDSVEITDTRTRSKIASIKTVKSPLISPIHAWSNDGSKILLNIEHPKGESTRNMGFVIVDVPARKANVVRMAGENDAGFGWDGQTAGVVRVYGPDLRFFDAAGNRLHDAVNIGTLPVDTQDLFSPSGRSFATKCPEGDDGELCLWDSESGARLRNVTTFCDKLLGWYDETHLYCWENDNAAKDRVEVVDFAGAEIRTLLDVPDGEDISPTFTRTT